jgi:quercetin dioxygenase-like cupin family protein
MMILRGRKEACMRVVDQLDQPEIKFVSKGWGYEKWIVNNDSYCGKILFFAKGKKCSIHYHKDKEETFYVHSGKLKVYYHDDVNDLTMVPLGILMNRMHTIILNPGDNFHIPPGRVHMMLGLEDTTMFEFSTHHEDSDSYRLIKGD